MNRKIKRTALHFFNIINVFTVTYDHINVSLLNYKKSNWAKMFEK